MQFGNAVALLKLLHYTSKAIEIKFLHNLNRKGQTDKPSQRPITAAPTV
jgi:hypothetical protein